MKSKFFTIYCDDIRSEIGGKSTLVGCYNGLMHIHGALPIQIPKFGISVHLLVSESELDIFARPDIQFVVYGTTGVEIFSANVDLSAMVMHSDDINASSESALKITEKSQKEKSEKFIPLNLNFLLSPVLVERDGFIRTRIKVGKKIIKIGSLMVMIRPISEMPT